jgi:hypothetical protein
MLVKSTKWLIPSIYKWVIAVVINRLLIYYKCADPPTVGFQSWLALDHDPSQQTRFLTRHLCCHF